MVAAGLNVVATSVWGESFLPCTTGWAPWAPMQCAPQAHDELFAATVGKHVLIVPFIESRANWSFRDEFPTFGGQVAPGTVSQIAHLIERYVQNRSHPEWANKWARVYDQSGEARYAVALIHASSNRLSAYDHAGYAAGFDRVAQAVFDRTAVNVGFFIDALPPNTFAPGAFRPSWQSTATCQDVYRCREKLKGDVNEDCRVDLSDLAALGENWLQETEPELSQTASQPNNNMPPGR